MGPYAGIAYALSLGVSFFISPELRVEAKCAAVASDKTRNKTEFHLSGVNYSDVCVCVCVKALCNAALSAFPHNVINYFIDMLTIYGSTELYIM